MDQAPQDPSSSAAGAAAAVRNLVAGLGLQTISAKLKQNAALKDAVSAVHRSAVISGQLVKALTAATWEVQWHIGDGFKFVTAKHQVRWLLNPNNCVVVQHFHPPPPLPDGAAAAADGLPPRDDGDRVQDGDGDTSSESEDDGEPEEAAPVAPEVAPAEEQVNTLCPHGLLWQQAEQPIVIDAREASEFPPLMRWQRGQHSMPSC